MIYTYDDDDDDVHIMMSVLIILHWYRREAPIQMHYCHCYYTAGVLSN